MNIPPIMFLFLGSGLVLILLVVGIITSLSTDRSQVEERLGRYTEQQKEDLAQQKEQLFNPVYEWLNRRVEGSSFGDRISRSLARADLKMKPGEYVLVQFLSAFAVALVGFFIAGKSFPLALLGAIMGFFLPGIYVKQQQSKRLIKFNDQLGDMLNLMVNGLRAGYSTAQAMEAVSRELPTPICDEFRRVIQEMQLGISMEQSLDNLLRRIPSDDLDLVITAINVQREVGGNLAEILDTISYTIRERVRIKGEIRVLTSQVLYSGRFLSMLPVILIMILYVLNRDYMMEFFKPENLPCGYIALGTGALMIMAGYFVMNKIADIEV